MFIYLYINKCFPFTIFIFLYLSFGVTRRHHSFYLIDQRVNKIDNTNITNHRSHGAAFEDVESSAR